jgi:hypothetical protein
MLATMAVCIRHNAMAQTNSSMTQRTFAPLLRQTGD